MDTSRDGEHELEIAVEEVDDVDEVELELEDGWKVMWLLLLLVVLSCDSRERPRSRCGRRRRRPLLSTRRGSVDRRGGAADFSILIYHSFLASLGEKWADVSSDIFRYLLLFSRAAPLDALLHSAHATTHSAPLTPCPYTLAGRQAGSTYSVVRRRMSQR